MNAPHPQSWLDPVAEWVAALRDDQLPAPVRTRVAFCALDWWGALTRGTRHPLADSYRIALAEDASGACSVAGLPGGRKADRAAPANAAISHLEEVDDGHRMAMMHPAVTTFPVTIALAERMNLPAERIRAAIVAGYEVGLRVGALLGKKHYGVCHTTATAGTFGATAAAAVALGLSAKQTSWAFGHAGTQAAGLWQFLDDGAEAAKALHPAMAARNALMAVRIAEVGIPGATRVLEGRRGMNAAWGLDGDPAILTDGLGRTFQIETTTIKGWPTCGQMHSSLDAMRTVLATARPRVDDIERIVVTGPHAQIAIAGVAEPRTFEEAKFSTALCMAFLVLEGDLNFANFGPRALGDPAVRELAKRIEVHEDEAFTARFPAERPARVDVILHDGRTLTQSRSFRRGDPEDPWSWDDLVARFATIADGLSDAGHAAVIQWSAALADASGSQGASIKGLFGHLNAAKETSSEA